MVEGSALCATALIFDKRIALSFFLPTFKVTPGGGRCELARRGPDMGIMLTLCHFEHRAQLCVIPQRKHDLCSALFHTPPFNDCQLPQFFVFPKFCIQITEMANSQYDRFAEHFLFLSTVLGKSGSILLMVAVTHTSMDTLKVNTNVHADSLFCLPPLWCVSHKKSSTLGGAAAKTKQYG